MTDETNDIENSGDFDDPELNGTDESSEGDAPPFMIATQYIKDISFESPASPDIFLNPVAVPNVDVHVDVTARSLGDNRFESSLKIEASANSEDRPIFIVDLTYSCITKIGDVPADHVQPLVMIEAPRIIFPFARAVLAGVTRDGGFQPLLINPIDFVELYRQRIAAHGATS
jgi:preprotein translocase subunit SecB